MPLLNIPVEFFLFACTLLGVAIFHRRNLEVAVAGLIAITLYKALVAQDMDLIAHFLHEERLVLNLLGLLLGFAILARHFELSKLPDWLPRLLPDDWKGGFVLLVMVAAISTFLDNIAAAIIGGVVAGHVYKHKISVGYMAAIVAASNAGGAGSVVGDTTTTMMWIGGVQAIHVADAFIASTVAVIFSGIIAAKAQQRYHPVTKNPPAHLRLDWGHLAIVALIIGGAIAANVGLDFPAAGVWAAIILGGLIRPTPWGEVSKSAKGALFLVALVLSASLMPVKELPPPSAHTAFGLGFVSAVFDNIPLTALALYQGGYDWGMLAFAVGFGGSMIWFGSSAGVAMSNLYPEAKNTLTWLREGWHVPVAYVLGFATLYLVLGWHPDVLPAR
ncbi:citrate transporter [Thiobacillus sedimenti]|uniref:Citrate transporter n=1 Tax=Thiobacillus sedimenti TaxID=3110231 RepID=A0ABZ1CPE1_9PROT|nr:citrate transporter [Thiobacillus sp. SCUT-2]WRS39813.1 citrate transporter [Thiobacillus sp. SCUT-2]